MTHQNISGVHNQWKPTGWWTTLTPVPEGQKKHQPVKPLWKKLLISMSRWLFQNSISTFVSHCKPKISSFPHVSPDSMSEGELPELPHSTHIQQVHLSYESDLHWPGPDGSDLGTVMLQPIRSSRRGFPHGGRASRAVRLEMLGAVDPVGNPWDPVGHREFRIQTSRNIIFHVVQTLIITIPKN